LQTGQNTAAVNRIWWDDGHRYFVPWNTGVGPASYAMTEVVCWCWM